MQDNRVHIDRKFTNHAWGEMRQLLEREMPVGQRRRRFFWWWLLPVGVALGWVAWGFLKNDEAKPAPPSVAPVQPIAGSWSQNSTSAGFETLPTFDQTDPSTDLSESLKLSQRSAVHPASMLQPESLQQNFLAALPHSAHIPQVRLPNNSSKMALKSPDATDLASNKPAPEKIRLSFFTGGMVAGNSLANGLALGSAATIPLKSSKLSLEVGLGYALVQQPLSVQVNQFPTGVGLATEDLVEPLEYTFARNSNKSADNYSLHTNYSTGVYLHYFQLPVAVRYPLTSKFSVHGGALAAYLFELSQGFEQTIELDAGGNGNYLNESDATVKIPLSRFDLAATGGLTWQFSRVFALDFQYRMGVADLLKSNDGGDFNRLFQLSLRYEVKRQKAKGKS